MKMFIIIMLIQIDACSIYETIILGGNENKYHLIFRYQSTLDILHLATVIRWQSLRLMKL